MRPALGKPLQANELDGIGDSRGNEGGRDPACPKTIGDVSPDRQVGKDRVVLEDHRGIAAMRRQPVDPPIAEADGAGIEAAESGNHAKKRGLAAPRRAEKGEKLTLADHERDLPDGGNRSE